MEIVREHVRLQLLRSERAHLCFRGVTTLGRVGSATVVGEGPSVWAVMLVPKNSSIRSREGVIYNTFDFDRVHGIVLIAHGFRSMFGCCGIF